MRGLDLTKAFIYAYASGCFSQCPFNKLMTFALDVSDGAYAIGGDASCGDVINDLPRLRIDHLSAARGGQDTLFGELC